MSVILARYLNDISTRLKDINKGLLYNYDKALIDWSVTQRAVKVGIAKDLFPLGSKVTITSGLGSADYTVVAHDFYDVYDSADTTTRNKLPHSMTLMCDSALTDPSGTADAVCFAQDEALIYVNASLAANTTYYFSTLDRVSLNTKLYHFTPSVSIPSGSYGVITNANASSTLGVTVSSISFYSSRDLSTLITTVSVVGGASGTLIATANDLIKAYYGDNAYSVSKIRGLLNSSESEEYQKHSGTYDVSDSRTIKGYLSSFDPELLDKIAYTHIESNGEDLYDRIFVPSESELFDNSDKCLPFFVGAHNIDRQRFSNTALRTLREYWLRDKGTTNTAYGIKLIGTDGSLSESQNAVKSVVPMFNIG